MAGQDIRKRLPPGGAQPVNVSGDYIYVKFADRPISIIINGGRSGQTRVTMEAGDKYRPGPFEQFEIENPDTTNPAQIILTVGEGDYNRQLVQGEIDVVPVLRSADGTTRPDTRGPLNINLEPVKLITKSYSRGDLIDSWQRVTPPDSKYYRERRLFNGPGGTIGLFIISGTDDDLVIQLYDPKTLYLIEQFEVSATVSGFVNDVVYANGQYLLLDNGDNIRNLQGAILANIETVTGNDNIDGIAYDPFNRRFVFLDYDKVFFMDEDFQNAGGWDLSTDHFGTASHCVRVDYWTGQYHIPTTKAIYVYEPVGEYLGELSYSGMDLDLDNGFVPYRNRLYCDNASLDGTQRYVRALRDYTTQPEFQAVRPGCGLNAALINPEVMPQITAQITVKQLGGQIRVTGQVIKAALEYYYKREAPDDYLDHVYQFDTTRDGSGLPFKTISAGNETLARADVEDDFETLLPGQILLVVDNELKMGSAL